MGIRKLYAVEAQRVRIMRTLIAHSIAQQKVLLKRTEIDPVVV